MFSCILRQIGKSAQVCNPDLIMDGSTPVPATVRFVIRPSSKAELFDTDFNSPFTSNIVSLSSTCKALATIKPGSSVGSPQSTTSAHTLEAATEFTLFPDLPPELRLMIWNHARPEPRVLRAMYSEKRPFSVQGYRYAHFGAKVPSLLHVNKEARDVALRWYKISFKIRMDKVGYFFDRDRDWVYMSCLRKPRVSLPWCNADARRFILGTRLTPASIDSAAHMIKYMSRGDLQELMLIHESRGMVGAEAKFSDFQKAEQHAFAHDLGDNLRSYQSPRTSYFKPKILQLCDRLSVVEFIEVPEVSREEKTAEQAPIAAM